MLKPILLLDEVEEDALLIKHFLQRLGLLVYVFTNPLLALDHFQLNHQNYSLVISGIRMSSITGIEFARKARKIDPSIKIFLMSTFKADNESRLSNLLSSVNIEGFFHKPISSDELKNVLEKYLTENKSKNPSEDQHSRRTATGTVTCEFRKNNRLEITKIKQKSTCNHDRFARTLHFLIKATKGGRNRSRILQILNLHPSNVNRIAHQLELHYKTVLFHLGVLLKYKFITTDIEAYGSIYFLSPIMKRRYDTFLKILSEIEAEQKLPLVNQ